MDEVSFALDEGKTVIPVICRDCVVPLRLRRAQYADFRKDYARGLKELLEILAPLLDSRQSAPAIDNGPGFAATDERKEQAALDLLELPFEAYSGDQPYVFVSYAHEDERLVFPELRALHEKRIRIWYDDGIAPGSEWYENIARALDLASLFLVFITKSAVESRHVRNEISFALDQGTPFLAVHLEDTKLPVGLKLRMGGIQGILKWRLRPEHYARKLASCFHPPLSGNKRPRCCNTQLRKHFGRTLLCPTVPLMVSKS